MCFLLAAVLTVALANGSAVPVVFTYVTDYFNNRVEKFNSSGTFLSQFGSPGSGNGQFNGPTGIAVDGSGNVWVVDSGNNRVQNFDSGGTFLSQFGSPGSGNGQLNGPTSIAIDGSGNIFVTEWFNNRVSKFDSSGNFLSKFGVGGSGDGQFNHPWGVAVDKGGNVWVSDYYQNRVEKFDSTGAFLSKFGVGGSNNGQFANPTGIAIDGSGNVWVVDSGNNRVEEFNSSGTFLSQFGSPGPGNGQFNGPNSITFDGSGNVWVTDVSNRRVENFDGSGTFLSKFGMGGSGNGQFNYPWGIAIGKAGPQTVYSTFGPGLSFQSGGAGIASFSQPGTSSVSLAADFTAQTTVTLSRIDIALSKAQSTSQVQVQLRSDSGGLPGAVLQSWLLTSLPDYAPSYTPESLSPASTVNLISGTKYWLAVVPVAGTDTQVQWGNGTAVTQGGKIAQSGDGGVTWPTLYTDVPGSVRLAFDVIGNP